MKKYDSGIAMMMGRCMCCCMCVPFHASESDLFSASNKNVVLHVGA